MEYAGIIAAVVAAIAAIVSGVVTNASNQDIAEENRQFQERMSSTAHQREVIDLRAAGLNPILSANHGASTPSGSTATMVNPLEGTSSNVTSAFSKYFEAKTQQSQAKKLNADEKLAEKSGLLVDQQAQTNVTQQSLNSALEAKERSQKTLNDANVLRTLQDTHTSSAQELKLRKDAILAVKQAITEEKRAAEVEEHKNLLKGEQLTNAQKLQIGSFEAAKAKNKAKIENSKIGFYGQAFDWANSKLNPLKFFAKE